DLEPGIRLQLLLERVERLRIAHADGDALEHVVAVERGAEHWAVAPDLGRDRRAAAGEVADDRERALLQLNVVAYAAVREPLGDALANDHLVGAGRERATLGELDRRPERERRDVDATDVHVRAAGLADARHRVHD